MTRKSRDDRYREVTLGEKWEGWERAREGAPLADRVIFYAGAAALLDLIRRPTQRTAMIDRLRGELEEFARQVEETREG